MTRTICFICVNFRCSDLINTLLASIAAQQDAQVHCLVVDNSPGDPALIPLSQRSDVTVLDAGRNRGFGGGCNLALNNLLERDPGAIAWLINPDAELLPGAIGEIRRCLAEPERPVLLGTRIADNSGNLWFDHGRFDRGWGRVNHEPLEPHHAQDIDPQSLLQPCDWLSGCSLILDLAALPIKPLFDEHIFLYYEDVDLCLRLKKAGITPYVTRDILVTHKVSATMQGRSIFKYRHATFGKLYLLANHATTWALALNLLRFVLRAMPQMVQDPCQARGRIQGALMFLKWRISKLSAWLRPVRSAQSAPAADRGSSGPSPRT